MRRLRSREEVDAHRLSHIMRWEYLRLLMQINRYDRARAPHAQLEM